MSPSRGLAASVVWMLSVLCATAAVADSYDNARRSIDLAPDPIERSPRLQGMGRLTLADDPHNRITLWDFAADPVGILDADSVSTFHLWPNTSSRSATHGIDNGLSAASAAVPATTYSTDLTGTGSDSEIHLSWNAIPNAEYYIIYRSENGGQTFYDPFGPIDGTQWDTGDIGDLAYYVVGVNNGVETAPSNIVYF